MPALIRVFVLAAVLYGALVTIGFGVGDAEVLVLLSVFVVGCVLILRSERRKATSRSASRPEPCADTSSRPGR